MAIRVMSSSAVALNSLPILLVAYLHIDSSFGLHLKSSIVTKVIITVIAVYAHHLRCVLACGVGIGLPVQWRNVAIWGNKKGHG
jgi:hypothetical protein